MALTIFKFLQRWMPNENTGSLNDLNNPLRIIHILKQLKDNRTMLKVNLPGSNKIYSSAVLNIDETQQHFAMDELHPQDGHKALLNKKSLYVHSQSDGVSLTFKAQLHRVGESSGIAYYDMFFPQMIRYVQRRASYRAHVSGTRNIFISVFNIHTQETANALVEDISVYGIRFLLTTQQEHKRGDRLTQCKLHIPGDHNVPFVLEIRHVQPLQNDQVSVGGCFKDMDVQNRRIIQKFVKDIEREAIKFKKSKQS